MTASQEGILYMIHSMVWNASLLQKCQFCFLLQGVKGGIYSYWFLTVKRWCCVGVVVESSKLPR